MNFDKLKESFVNEKKNIIIIAIVLIACFVAYDVFRSGNIEPGADAVRNDIQSAGQHNDAAISELDRAKQATRDFESINQRFAESSKRLSETSERLSAAQQEFDRLAQQDRERIDRNKELIEQGKRIIRQVRERSQGQN